MAVLGMAEWKLAMHFVRVATAVPCPRQVPSRLEVIHDLGDRPLGDSYARGYVSETCVRISGDALKDMGVVRHEAPRVISSS